jgi:membrane associated rhomboid family serine protease
MNWILVALVIFIFSIQLVEINQVRNHQMSLVEYKENSITAQYLLDGWSIKGLFGYMWLHGGLWHLIGNLIFLWLFGNAVCSKIGNLYYLPVYIFLGLVAGISHLLFSDVPILGASGAINGIVGMYLVFFPENSISCFFCFIFWFWRPLWFSLRSFWMILLWFAFDIFGAMRSSGGVAYLAHIGGFVAGVGLAILMLKIKMIEMERDETSILKLLGLETKDKPTERRGDFAPWQQEWEDIDRKETKKEPIPFEPEETQQQYIHLRCRCGQRIKILSQYAGKIGQCPKCSAKWKIPEV